MSSTKKETWKTVINFIITVLTAIVSTFAVQSCMAEELTLPVVTEELRSKELPLHSVAEELSLSVVTKKLTFLAVA